VIASAEAYAATTTVTLNASDSGYYTDNGNHTSLNSFVTVGFGGTACGSSDEEFRDFFVFDLSGVSDEVVAATLRVQVPGSGDGYESPDPSEDLSLFEVTTSVPTLTAGGLGMTAIYDDLGDGPAYGTRTFTAADETTIVDVALNAAGIAAINAAIGGDFALGGALTTLTSTPPTCELLFPGANPTTKQLILEVNATDHYQCYKAKDLKNPRFTPQASVTLADQFGTGSVAVMKPFSLCAPVDKNGEGVLDPLTHLCCYKIKGAVLSPPAQATVADQFGSLDVEVKKRQLLCQPCTKTLLP
jgi:hypothetical protein